jgi:hypothetical protein
MGLLDQSGGLLNGLPASWQYQNPQDELDKKQLLRDLMQNPMEGFGPPPAPSPFGPIPQIAPKPAPGVFDTGASGMAGGAGVSPAVLMPRTAPFSLGGPPQQPVQPQQPAQPQQPSPQPAARPMPIPASAWRPGATPDYGQDHNVAVGNYRMPMFGKAEEQPPISTDVSVQTRQPQFLPQNANPGIGDRLSAGLTSVAHSKGLFPALLNGIQGFATGQRTDPDAMQANLTAQALLAKGASPQDVQAALVQPKLMEALINQHFAKQPAGAVTPRWDGRGRLLR